MNREEILALYEWQHGTCFRHPGKDGIETARIKTIQSRLDGEKEIRACRNCILAMEAIRREVARRAGGEYVPGHAGEAIG